jgi:hypothetical protein
VFDPERLPEVKQRIREATQENTYLFDSVEQDVSGLRAQTVTIQPRSTNTISLVASDAGNNKIEFNPLLLQMVRVVDSKGKELVFDVISSETDTRELSRRQFGDDGTPVTPLGKLMRDLNVEWLWDLTSMIPQRPETSGWTIVFRDLCEWAAIYEQCCYKEWGQDTLLLHDGLLRTKVFKGDLFVQMYHRIKESIDQAKRVDRRDLFLVGIAKHSEVLERYRLAMALSNVFPGGAAQYVPIPMDMQKKVYKWNEYLRLPTDTAEDVEQPKYNMGEMYFVRFGTRTGDPVWTVDLLAGQTSQAQKIFGSLLSDAEVGFPVPYYPDCLQKADAHAQVVDLDLAILQDAMIDALRDHLGPQRKPIFDAHQLVASDPAARRYS